ncbi:MAG TPA: hypothetical protein PK600_10010, partial [Deltaproteobacteria bacterium]|nr:hypothetical protein [Deltaproteobacteria bacterium]
GHLHPDAVPEDGQEGRIGSLFFPELHNGLEESPFLILSHIKAGETVPVHFDHIACDMIKMHRPMYCRKFRATPELLIYGTLQNKPLHPCFSKSDDSGETRRC